MKYALISEEQIKQIEDAVKELMYSNSTDVSWGKFKKVGELLESLKPQKPVARFNWNEAKFEWLTKYDYHKHHMKSLYALGDTDE